MVKEMAEAEGIQHVRAGSGGPAPDLRPGDFILTHGSHWTSRLIRVGQTLRFRGNNRMYAYWNHAALIVGAGGEIIEALGPSPGVVQQNVSKYAPREYTIVRIRASAEDRDETVGFARACLGERYGVLAIVSIAISLLTGTRFSFGFAGQMICSGLVARALERTRAIFTKEPSHIMPADLARAYLVTPPES